MFPYTRSWIDRRRRSSTPNLYALYKYRPLAGPIPIRLICLEPDLDQNKLVCRLEHFSLDKHPSYLALSYVWGDSKVTTRLKCNDCYLHITKNLEAALFNLRSPRKRRWLWVDAICIRQEDPDEKAAQIQMMRHIYAQSMQTIVRLGEAGDDGFLAATLIHTLNFYMTKHSEWNEQLLEDDLDVLGIGNRSRPFLWQALRRFYDRPYFRRVWVVQEVAVSKNLMVVFGSMTLDYGYLERVIRAMPAQFKFESFIPSAIFTLRAVYQELRKENHALPLSYLMFWDPKLQATMAVDKIYAWLGLSDEAENPVFQPDYRSDERSTRGGSSIGVLSPLYLLYAAGIKEGDNSKLPTWLFIPHNANTPRCVEAQMLSRRQRFSVSGFSGSRIHFSDDSEVLHVQGRELDCIKFLGPKMGPLEKQHDGDDVETRGIKSVLSVQAGGNEGQTRASSYAWEEAYWRTAILNTDDSGNNAGPEFGKYLDGGTRRYDTRNGRKLILSQSNVRSITPSRNALSHGLKLPIMRTRTVDACLPLSAATSGSGSHWKRSET
ncbi:MAG: hypothetical protein M1830_007925 [Pleopsidium flavum]|nr:MAG: hypothetical protein M1830_007925 [Pleopsidium flavum]